MEKINIPHKICAYAKTDESGADDVKTQPNWTAWTSEKIAEWFKVTGKLRPVINNLDHEIYFCCYPKTKDYMTTKPEREGNDK
jgi:hypothetical protein